MKRRTRPVSVGGRRPPAGRVQPVLVWMDLEMTGLEPAHNVIVEIATIITDDELNIVAEGPDLVVHQPEEALAMMEQIVVEMHTKSGLLDQIRASTITLEEAGAQTLRSSSSTCRRPARCRCAATPSAWIVASLPPTCPRSRTTCTTAAST